MRYKKIMLLIIILTCLLAVSAVSAANNATDDIVSVDETTDEIVTMDENNQVTEQTENEETIGTTDDGTFTALQNKINNAASESTITLENDYDYDDGFDIEGININKSLTIDGNGHMLNGNNKARIFNIAAQNVILKNIDFSNSLYSYDNGITPTRAGAIYWAGDNGMLLNCMFTNSSAHSPSWNTANNWGGAVYWDGTGGILSGCTFNNCYATLNSNHGECRGGAIYWAGANGNLSGSNFINCFAKSSIPGDSYGGAIYWAGSSGVLSDCNFRKCLAHGSFGDGGAICWIGNYGTLKDSNFTDNSASYAGGAIDFSYADYCNIYGCNFVKCSSDFGGAIAVRSTSEYSHVYNSKFESCSADKGGAVVWYGVGNLRYCNFTGCHAVDGGGSVYWNGDYGELYDCRFVNSTCNAEGGAVYWRNNDGELYNCNFLKSKANDGGAVYWYGKNGELYDCSFLDSSSNNNGGAVYWFNIDGKLSRTSFVNSVSKGNGGAVYWYGDEGKIIRCEYAKNSSNKNDIYISGKNVEIIDNLVKISAEDVIKYYGGSEKFIVTLTDDGTALSNVNVKVSANGETSTVTTDSNGKASILLNLSVGTYDVLSEYDGVSTTSKFNIKSTITVNDAIGTYLNSKVSATFLDTTGKALASKQVTFKAGDKTYAATTNSNGVATADVDLGAGTYTVTAINPVNNEQKQFELTISKASSNILLESSQNNGVTTLTATLTPAAATGNVVFSINGENKNAQIKDGVATLTLSNLSPGDYTATARYDGDNNLNADEKTVSFKVIEVETPTNNTDASTENATDSNTEDNNSPSGNTTDNNGSIKPDVTIPPLDEPSSDGSVTVTLPSDATGTVTLTINGKNEVFNVVNGKANVKLPDLSNGNYPYTITYSGDSKYSSFTSSSTLSVDKTQTNPTENVTDNTKITASPTTVTYNAGSYFKITVYGADGKLADGVTVTIFGKISKTLTTKDGVAKFKVTQKPGTYKITITALGKSVTKTITVKHLVTLKAVTLNKSAKKLTLQATLAKVNGKYLKKKTITFKINGKKVATAKTNNKGIAKVTIKNPNVVKNLKVGKQVKYQAIYLKDTVTKTTKIKK